MGNAFSDERVEKLGAQLVLDSAYFADQQIEMLEEAKTMFATPETLPLFIEHAYAFKYLLLGLNSSSAKVHKQTLEVLLEIVTIPESAEVEERGRDKDTVLCLVGTKISLYWTFVSAEELDVQIVAVTLLIELTAHSINISRMAALSIKKILFYMQPAYPNKLKTLLAKLLRIMLSNPTTLCFIDAFGPEPKEQIAWIRSDVPEQYLCESCAAVCGANMSGIDSVVVKIGKQIFACNCRHGKLCMLQMPKPDRAKEVFELRGLETMVQTIMDPSTEPECIGYLLEALVEMTDTDVTKLILNKNFRDKRLHFQISLYHDITHRAFRPNIKSFVGQEILKMTNAGTKVLDCILWALEPPCIKPSSTDEYNFEKHYPYALTLAKKNVPHITSMALKCLSNLCKAITLQNRLHSFETAFIVRIPGTSPFQVDSVDDNESNDDEAIAKKASDTSTVMRNTALVGKLWHIRLLKEASKRHTPYSNFIVEKIQGFMIAMKAKNTAGLVQTQREIMGLKRWEEKLARIRTKKSSTDEAVHVPIIATPKFSTIGKRDSEGWRIVIPNLPAEPLNAKCFVFYTERNVEGYNEEHVLVRSKNEDTTVVDSDEVANKEFETVKPAQQLPLWEVLDFDHDIARIDLGPGSHPAERKAYKDTLSFTKRMSQNTSFKRPGTTVVKFVVVYLRAKKEDKEAFIPLPSHLRRSVGMPKAVIIGASKVLETELYVNQPLRENVRRVRLRLQAKSKQMNAERCIIDTFSRGFSQTLRDSSSVTTLLGCPLGTLNIFGQPNSYAIVNGLRVLVEYKRMKAIPASIYASVALIQLAIHRRNNLSRHQMLNLLEGINDLDSWVEPLNQQEESTYVDLRGNSITVFVAQSLYGAIKKIVLMEETLAQRFIFLLGTTLMDLIDTRFDEPTRLLALKTCGLLPMSPGGKCADCVVNSGILDILLAYETHNASELVVTEALVAAVGYGIHERFQSQMRELNAMEHFQNLQAGANSMLTNQQRVNDFAVIGSIILNPIKIDMSPKIFKRSQPYQHMMTFLRWVDPNIDKEEIEHSVEDKWKAMGALVALSRCFSTHFYFTERENFRIILENALASSLAFPVFGSAPGQKEAVEVLRNISQNPAGMILWLPFLESKRVLSSNGTFIETRLPWDYSGNQVPVIAETKRPHTWIGDVEKLKGLADGSDSSSSEEEAVRGTRTLKHTATKFFAGAVIGPYNVIFTAPKGIPLPRNWTISVWFRGGPWIRKRPHKPNFYYTLAESTKGDKLIALDYLCNLGFMASGPVKPDGLKHARWYSTGFDFSNAAHTGVPFSTEDALDEWFHVVVVGQIVEANGKKQENTIFFVNGVVVKTISFKLTSDLYAIGNTAHRSDPNTHWEAISQFRLYEYAFPRSPLNWPAEVVKKPAVNLFSLSKYHGTVKGQDNPFYILKTLSNNTALINGLFYLLQSDIIIINELALATLYNLVVYPPTRIIVAQNHALLQVLDKFSRSTNEHLKLYSRRVMIAIY